MDNTVDMARKSGVKKTLYILIAIIGLVFGLTFNKFLTKPTLTVEQLSQMGTVIFDTPRAVTFAGLNDHNGQVFTNDNVKDGWTIVYFGYTFCPDICPITLSQLNKFATRLRDSNPKLAEKLHYVMVSVDPRRDTTEKMKGYVPHFNPDFVGVTGDIKGIHDLTVQMNIPFTPVVNPEDEFYLVDHGANLAVINPRGDYHGFIRPPFEPAKLVEVMTAIDKLY